MLGNNYYFNCLAQSYVLCIIGIIIFTLLCGFTYSEKTLDKYGNFNYSLIANTIDYNNCDDAEFVDILSLNIYDEYGEMYTIPCISCEHK